MRRKFLLALLIIIIFQLGSSLGLTADDNYYPLQIGNSWTYRIDVEGQIMEAEIRVTQKAIINNLETMEVDAFMNGVLKQREYYFVATDGVFMVKRRGFQFEPMQSFLKYPVVNGVPWSQKGKLFDDNHRYLFYWVTSYNYEGMTAVSVPAGFFNVLKLVVVDEVSDGSVSHTTRYFANGIGIVKEINRVELRGRIITQISQLVKYHIIEPQISN